MVSVNTACHSGTQKVSMESPPSVFCGLLPSRGRFLLSSFRYKTRWESQRGSCLPVSKLETNHQREKKKHIQNPKQEGTVPLRAKLIEIVSVHYGMYLGLLPSISCVFVCFETIANCQHGWLHNTDRQRLYFFFLFVVMAERASLWPSQLVFKVNIWWIYSLEGITWLISVS